MGKANPANFNQAIMELGADMQAHKEAIIKYGSCPVHRRTFKGVKEVINDR